MVGPNGAGKTTTIECIEGLRQPDGGSLHVLGMDPSEERGAIANRIGVQLQESALPPRLRVNEAMICSLGAENRLVFTLPDNQTAPPLTDLPQVQRVEQLRDRVVVYGHGQRFASSVVYALEDAAVDFLDLHTEQPNLEDVFLSLTGREIRE